MAESSMGLTVSMTAPKLAFSRFWFKKSPCIVNPSIPPFNPARFSKLDLPRLQECARQWFMLDSAFAMCLNAALLRGLGSSFAAGLAQGLSEAPVAQAFYLYRSAGLLAQAAEVAKGPIASLIHAKQPLPGIVLDAVVMAKTHDQALYKDLLRKIVEAKPDLTMTPTAHAFLHYEILQALGPEDADALNSYPATGEARERGICIGGITMMRNEREIAIHHVGNMLEYCDFVLIFGHVPDDGGPEEAQEKFGTERVGILRLPEMSLFDSKRVYDFIFPHMRTRGATHFVHIDADERLAPRLADRIALKEQARHLQPGEALAVPFPQVFGDGLIAYNAFAGLNDLSRLLPPWKDLLYCDDGGAMHRRMPVHNPWLPNGYPTRRNFVNGADAGLLHFEKANPMNAFVKTDYYIAKELVLYKTPMPIVLARYLPAHLLNNALYDAPPPPNALVSNASHNAYNRPAWHMDDLKILTPNIPPELRFLFNLDYWS